MERQCLHSRLHNVSHHDLTDNSFPSGLCDQTRSHISCAWAHFKLGTLWRCLEDPEPSVHAGVSLSRLQRHGRGPSSLQVTVLRVTNICTPGTSKEHGIHSSNQSCGNPVGELWSCPRFVLTEMLNCLSIHDKLWYVSVAQLVEWKPHTPRSRVQFP